MEAQNKPRRAASEVLPKHFDLLAASRLTAELSRNGKKLETRVLSSSTLPAFHFLPSPSSILSFFYHKEDRFSQVLGSDINFHLD